MKSLAYLVGFLIACVIIGGPLALGITLIRTERRRSTITKSIIAGFLGVISILVGLVLVVNTGGLISKSLGFIGLSTGIPAVLRSARTVKDVF